MSMFSNAVFLGADLGWYEKPSGLASIEAILEGRQPRDLNFEKLCKHIPLSWTEQRAHFGFPPVSSH